MIGICGYLLVQYNSLNVVRGSYDQHFKTYKCLKTGDVSKYGVIIKNI